MKTIFTSLCGLFIFIQITTAQYIPFPTNDATWSMEILDVYNNDYALFEIQGFAHETIGDTMINGLLYQKVYQRQTWWSEDYFNELNDGTVIDWFASGNYNDPPILIGGLRQDIPNRKVFFIRFIPDIYSIMCIQPISESDLPVDQEVLIFDFAVNEGDTIYLGGNEDMKVIESIDSVLLNDGLYHKVYTTDDDFLEGVGSYAGLFGGIRGPFVEGEWCNLNCFAEEGEYIIGESLFGCDSVETIVPVIEIDQENSLTISPNPFQNYIRMEIPNTGISNLRFSLFNTLGQPVLQALIPAGSNQYNLNTASLAPGIYWLSVYDQQKLIGTQSVVKY